MTDKREMRNRLQELGERLEEIREALDQTIQEFTMYEEDPASVAGTDLWDITDRFDDVMPRW